MNCKIDTTPDFARDLKQLAKRYPSMKDDYRDFLDALRKSPLMLAKAALKAVAKRLGGPIAVGLVVAEWGLCVGGLG